MDPIEDTGPGDRRTLVLIGSAVVAVLLVALAVFALTGDDGDDDDETVAAVDPDEPAATEAPADDEQAADDEEPADSGCPPEDGSGPQVLQFDAPPPVCIDESATYEATMVTSEGDIVITLDPALDPVSVNNFIFLARNNYYDGTTFHRVIESFVIQGGDPVGNPRGTGGPGYDFQGGPGPESGYELGSFAMANRGDPSSNGAQFFIITGPNGQALPPLYSPMGIVTEGLDVALAIQTVPTEGADQPVDDVIVEDVVITEVG
ncbi:MAG: peptidylprolyl isomerase [Actinomycetota bacterium]